MSWVGPRPEDPRIVERHFTREYRQTLRVLPGLTSPGNLYNYTHEELLLADDDPEVAYVTRVLPIKMALERVYVARALLRLRPVHPAAHALHPGRAGPGQAALRRPARAGAGRAPGLDRRPRDVPLTQAVP
jgi:hypothetical protein